jgi:hypothetical protein
VDFIGIPSISHHFQFEVTSHLAHNALFFSMAKKHVVAILKLTYSEGWLSSKRFNLDYVACNFSSSIIISNLKPHFCSYLECNNMLYGKVQFSNVVRTQHSKKIVCTWFKSRINSVLHRIFLHLSPLWIWSQINFGS